jgi:hypothetical protein
MESLEQQAAEMTTAELRDALSWQEALADHADENMDFGNYDRTQEKMTAIRVELAKRGKHW